MKLPDIDGFDKDAWLAKLGVATKTSDTAYWLEALGTFGLGLLVGAGLALLWAPKPGRELRDDIRARVRPGSKADPFEDSSLSGA